MLGGLITPIAISLGMNVSNTRKATSSKWIDMEVCINMNMVIYGDRVWLLKFWDGTTFSLANPKLTAVQEVANWQMVIPPFSPGDTTEEEEAPTPAPLRSPVDQLEEEEDMQQRPPHPPPTMGHDTYADI